MHVRMLQMLSILKFHQRLSRLWCRYTRCIEFIHKIRIKQFQRLTLLSPVVFYSIGKNCISYEKMEPSPFIRLFISLSLTLSPSLWIWSQCLNPVFFHVVCSLLCKCKFSAPKLKERLEQSKTNTSFEVCLLIDRIFVFFHPPKIEYGFCLSDKFFFLIQWRCWKNS